MKRYWVVYLRIISMMILYALSINHMEAFAGDGGWVGKLTYHRNIDKEWSKKEDIWGKETMEVTVRCKMDIRATIPLLMKKSADIFMPGAYQHQNITGPYSISYEKVVIEKHIRKGGSTFTITTTTHADCKGELPSTPSISSMKMANLSVDENNKTYRLDISFSYDGGCTGISTVKSSDGEATKSTWEVEGFSFDTWQLGRIYSPYPFEGHTDGKTIQGSWKSPEQVDVTTPTWCGVDGTTGVTVEWSLTKTGD